MRAPSQKRAAYVTFIVNIGVFVINFVQDVSWEDGLKKTVEWYMANSSRFGDIEQCLVAHPRAGLGKTDGSLHNY